MKMKTKTILAVFSLALGAAIALPAGAQEVLPKPEQPYKGKIARTAAESTPDFPKPFFAYYAPGLCHAPHHAPKEWIAKFKGQFDQGWD